jgi:chromate transport protein ChrA
MGMYGLSLGISNVGDVLPAPAYALLSGLNAATVGVIALAAVQLSQKAITDKVTRVLVFLGATAGMLYNALWFFPVLILLAGPVTIIWDFRWLHPLLKKASKVVRRIRETVENHDDEMSTTDLSQASESKSGRIMQSNTSADIISSRADVARPQSSFPGQGTEDSGLSTNPIDVQTPSNERQDPRVIPMGRELNVSWKFGTILIVGFLVTFITIMIVRGVMRYRPILFSLFSNMYLAGTIIFGGGPVIVPLLRQ